MADVPPVADSIAKVQQQFSRLTEEVARLALGDLAPADFFQQFLQRVTQALAAPAGMVWTRTEHGNYQHQCQSNPGNLNLEFSGAGRVLHEEILREAIQHVQPRVIPAPDDGTLAELGTILMTSALVNEQVECLVEVFLGVARDGDAVPSLLYSLDSLTRLVSVYLIQRQQQQHDTLQRQIGEQLDAFARRVHGSLHPTEVAYLVANEGRMLIGCDRLTVAVWHGRRAAIEAISGVDVVDQRSKLVRRLRQLCDRVLAWGEKLVYRGVPDSSLPPEVLHNLDSYLEENQSKILMVLPLHDEREKKVQGKPRSALVLECFESAAPVEQLEARLHEVAKHATTALHNSAAYRNIPFRWLWRPVALIQEGLGGKTRSILYSVAAVVVILIGVLTFVPYPLKMDAKGQLLPQSRRYVFAPVEGQIVRFEEGVEPGKSVSENQHLILMFDVQLENKILQLQSQITSAQQDILALSKQLTTAQREEDRLRISAEQLQKQALRDAKSRELRALQDRTNSDTSRAGHFWITSPMRGLILSYDFKEHLTNRQVKSSEPLLRVGDRDKRWEVELKIPQKHVGQVLQAFDPNDPAAELEVDLLVTSEPTRTYKGKLARTKLSGEANPNKDDPQDAEPVVLASVRIDGPDIAAEDRIPPQLLTAGIEVHSKIRCGERAMGYSLFYGIWEFFYEKVIFWF